MLPYCSKCRKITESKNMLLVILLVNKLWEHFTKKNCKEQKKTKNKNKKKLEMNLE